jgi:hypothetical protein
MHAAGLCRLSLFQGLIFLRAAGGQRADAQDATSPRVPRLGVAALCTHTITDFDTCPARLWRYHIYAPQGGQRAFSNAASPRPHAEMRVDWIGPETPASQNTMHSSMHFQCLVFPLGWSPSACACVRCSRHKNYK